MMIIIMMKLQINQKNVGRTCAQPWPALQPLVAMVSTSALSLITAIFSRLVLVNLMGCMWWNMAVGEGLEYSWAAHIRAWQQRAACVVACLLAFAYCLCMQGWAAQGSHQQLTSSSRKAAGLSSTGCSLPAENKEYDLLTASNFQRWVISCYFSLTTMVTIGAPRSLSLPASQAACRPAASCSGSPPSLLNGVSFSPTPLLCRCSAGYGDITPVTISEAGLVLLFEVVGGAPLPPADCCCRHCPMQCRRAPPPPGCCCRHCPMHHSRQRCHSWMLSAASQIKVPLHDSAPA